MVREMEKPETLLPYPSGNQSADDHLRIRDRFWDEHLPIEMDKGNRLQASEKIWGSVAHAVNAIATDRGWRTGDRDAIRDVVIQLGAEHDSHLGIPKSSPYQKKPEFYGWFTGAVEAHNNFYRNDLHPDAIKLAEGKAEQLISELEKLQGQKPKSYAPSNDDDIRRLGRLLDIREPGNPRRYPSIDYLKQLIEMGKPDPNGFSPNYGYRKPGSPDDDGEGNGGGVSNPDPPADGGQGGGATINDVRDLQRRPFVQSFTTEEHPGKPGPTNWKTQRQEPKARAAVAAHSSRPGRERRQVIAPRFGGRR